MIKFVKGNIFSSNAQTLVNTVNCVGVMGKGLAKEFKDRFPDMCNEYVKACRQGQLRSGKPFIYKDLLKTILCFPTKDNWKGPSRYEFIEAGLKALVENYQQWGITSIAIPPLGTGLGGLDWKRVKKLIVEYLSRIPIDVEVYEPLGDPNVRVAPKRQKQIHGEVKLTPTLIYVGELIRLARKLLPKEIILGRLLLQKLAFFSQVAGVPMKLKFTGYQYGPFDYNLKHVIDRLEGFYIRDDSTSWERSNLRMLDENEWLNATAFFNNEELKFAREKMLAAIELVAENHDLRETELLSTILFAWCDLVSSGNSGMLAEIFEFIHQWKPNKFDNESITTSYNKLKSLGWFGFESNKPPLNAPLEQLDLVLN